MNSFAVIIDIAIALIAIIAIGAYWAAKNEKAGKEGKPRPRRRIW